MTLEEIVAVARTGAAQGCTEALFTLGKRNPGSHPGLLPPCIIRSARAIHFEPIHLLAGDATSSAGDKPEDLYPEAAAELQQMGHTSTVSYVAEAARVVFQETGLLPHINAGTLQLSQLTDLRRWSASQVGSTNELSGSWWQRDSLLPVNCSS